MDAIRIPIKVESTTLELPQLEKFKGQVVVVTVTPVSQPAVTLQDIDDVLAAVGPIDIDPEIYKRQREFDRQDASDHQP